MIVDYNALLRMNEAASKERMRGERLFWTKWRRLARIEHQLNESVALLRWVIEGMAHMDDNFKAVDAKVDEIKADIEDFLVNRDEETKAKIEAAVREALAANDAADKIDADAIVAKLQGVIDEIPKVFSPSSNG
jgi:hypothetical protein